MRALLNPLTRRGKTFLGLGVASVLAGLIFSESDLFRIGLLLIVLPVLSALVTSRARYRLSCTRQLVPRRIQAGQTAEARVRLSNVSRLRTGLLLAEDITPATVASPVGRPRFVLESVEPGGSRDLSHQIEMSQRGKYTIGPLQVRVADAFGLAAIGRSFSTKSTLVVTPPITALPCVGIVVKLMFPLVRPCICCANVSRSQLLESTTERFTASSSSCSLLVSVSIEADSTLLASAPRNTCWRTIRSRSPLGRPWRCRTNASACGPFSVCGPAPKFAPEKLSLTGLSRHTSAPPTASVMSANPSRLTSE